MNHFRKLPLPVLYAVYGFILALHPFAFSGEVSGRMAECGWGFLTFFAGSFTQVTRRDFIVNVVFFIPFGVLLYDACKSPQKSSAAIILLAVIARHFGTDHTEEVLRPDPVSFLDNFTRYLDEPIGDVSIFPMFLVSSLARQKMTVALSGDGGDELFGGL